MAEIGNEKELERQRRREYYESLSPEEKKIYRAKRIRERKLQKLKRMVMIGAMVLLVVIAVIGISVQKGCKGGSAQGSGTTASDQDKESSKYEEADFALSKREQESLAAENQASNAPDWVIVDMIRKNKYTRPGKAMEQVTGIVLHAVPAEKVSAEQRRIDLDRMAVTKESDTSTHFIVGIDGTVIQCIPLEEKDNGTEEQSVISVQYCYVNEGGQISKGTYESLVRLLQWLVQTYTLDHNAVVRHSTEGGAPCPVYYVNNEEAWTQLLTDISTAQ